MTTQTAIDTRLAELMRQQHEQAEALIDYLKQVREAIASNAISRLQDLLDGGSTSLPRLESLQQQQSALLQPLGFADGAQGLHDYLQTRDSKALREQGEGLARQLELLRNALLINDLLIRKNQHRIRQSIRLLSGRDQASNRPTYSRNGIREDNDLEPRSLATV